MLQTKRTFGTVAESLIYPLLLILLLWAVWLFEVAVDSSIIKWGMRPGQWDSWKGILMMPLLHDPSSVKHVLNNSIPAYLLLAALIYYYREIALRVFVWSWLGTGIIVWLFAHDKGAFHIGFSGIVYALFGFLFVSGFLRRIRNLQGITLAVSFVYGSMIWGMFPIEEKISWEGHLGGFIMGVLLAVFYRKYGPQRPKYQYEIEKELGIEPPDLEGIWRRNQEEYDRMEAERKAWEEAIKQEYEQQQTPIRIIYHHRPKEDE